MVGTRKVVLVTVKTNRARALHISWVTAGQRRLIARALCDGGFTQAEVAKLLNVSPAQVSRDVADATA